MDLSKKVVRMVNQQLGVYLPQKEAGNIALHIINAEVINEDGNEEFADKTIVEDIVHLVENELDVRFDKKILIFIDLFHTCNIY